MTEIRDPIHGYVKLDELAEELVSTSQMQRLRWIKQLGLANLVYPGASHTRFEHSLGVYHLAGVVARHLGLNDEDRLRVCAAGLMHDIGHGPLSHATESVLSSCLRREHENIADILRRDEPRAVLGKFGIQPHEIQSLVKGEGKLGQIVSGEIDVDRMDYLIRDAHYTGVAYGVIDHLRLIEKMRIHQGELVMESGGIQAAASLLVSRLLMHPTVYFHHVCRISECMIGSGIRHMIDNGFDPAQIKGMDDAQLFSAMTSHGGYPEEMVDRIKTRRLFKRAVYVGEESIDPQCAASERMIAREIAEEAGVDPSYVLTDCPPLPDAAEGDFPMLIDGVIRPLRDVSPLVTSLERAHRATWRFGVYSRPEDRDKVARAAKRCLNLKRTAVQYTLSDLD
ncbi:MAG TPA: HD domain-containing protein [Methanotrichaceae archaeon]|nr:HD domain-containing protein [Methanotrichaceae archaeon]